MRIEKKEEVKKNKELVLACTRHAFLFWLVTWHVFSHRARRHFLRCIAICIMIRIIISPDLRKFSALEFTIAILSYYSFIRITGSAINRDRAVMRAKITYTMMIILWIVFSMFLSPVGICRNKRQ